jgi:hypothetical protein
VKSASPALPVSPGVRGSAGSGSSMPSYYASAREKRRNPTCTSFRRLVFAAAKFFFLRRRRARNRDGCGWVTAGAVRDRTWCSVSFTFATSGASPKSTADARLMEVRGVECDARITLFLYWWANANKSRASVLEIFLRPPSNLIWSRRPSQRRRMGDEVCLQIHSWRLLSLSLSLSVTFCIKNLPALSSK